MTPLWQREPVGVVGLGLIGGSLGLDLIAAGAQVRALVHRSATAERARERGLASAGSTD
ncbi:arogenate dehydrogenase, partial [Synechococcus sp. BA-120 BA3]|nr:arogenate dehydrogenase [Synechococcus sp. BA-120 BA3]